MSASKGKEPKAAPLPERTGPSKKELKKAEKKEKKAAAKQGGDPAEIIAAAGEGGYNVAGLLPLLKQLAQS